MVRATLKPSRLLGAAFAAVHASAAATLLPLALSLELRIACAALIAASLIHSIWRYALLSGPLAITARYISPFAAIGASLSLPASPPSGYRPTCIYRLGWPNRFRQPRIARCPLPSPRGA